MALVEAVEAPPIVQEERGSLINPEEACRTIYGETRRLYDEIAPQLGCAALGFRVLYGPPIVRAPYLFMAFQPGGGAEDAAFGLNDDHHDGWPHRSDYATAKWPLAREIRFTWGDELVARCPGLNAIFFRAPSMKAWKRIPKGTRKRLEEFSLERARRIVELLNPHQIVVIGFGTFDQLGGHGEAGLVGVKGRTLTKHGNLWGRPATTVLHLSGCQISGADRNRLRDHFRSEISN